jgi:hypothetical protein
MAMQTVTGLERTARPPKDTRSRKDTGPLTETGPPKNTRSRKDTGRRDRLSPGWRKGLLTAHVVLSVAWIGLAGCLIALATVGLNTGETWVYRAIGLLGGTFLLPVGMCALVSGIVLGLGTKWGLIRHYWVAAKLFVTIVLVLAGQLALGRFISVAAERAAAGEDVGEYGLRVLDGSIANLVLLVALTVLSVYKPWGRTRRGKALLKGAGS